MKPLEQWVSKSSRPFSKPDAIIFIDYLYVQDFGTPEGIGTQYSAERGIKGSRSVKSNAITTNDGVTISMRVKCNGGTDVEFIRKAIWIKSENSAQIGQYPLDRGIVVNA